MTQRTLHGVALTCIMGDIANQPDIDAIVNAAHAEPRNGFASTLYQAAGPGLEAESRAYSPCYPGETFITGAHGLPNRYVIHCMTPGRGRDNLAARTLAACYRNALGLAEDYGVTSLAFPAIAAGRPGYPLEDAAHLAFGTIHRLLPHLAHVRYIRFVLRDDISFRLYTRAMHTMHDILAVN